MKTIAIDFDGVIHQYSKGWQDGSCYDVPVMGAFEAIKQLLNDGYSVFILSTRNSNDIFSWMLSNKAPFMCGVIENSTQFWNGGDCVGITNRKLPAHVYIDDRAMSFKGNWGDIIPQITGFKTYQEN